MYIKCKRDFLIDDYSLITKDSRYFVTEDTENHFYITDDTGRGLLISKIKNNSHIHIYFGDYFYTIYDLRKIKIDSLIKKEA